MSALTSPPKRFVRALGVLALATLAVTLFSACVANPPPPAVAPTQAAVAPTAGAASTTAPEQATQAPAQPTTQAASEEMIYGLPRKETFVVGMQNPSTDVWDSFNEWQVSTTNNSTGYEQLVVEVPFIQFGDTVWPWLAQSWKYNDDGTEFTLNITEGVNWNDGQPLTIDDWIFTLDQTKANADKGIMYSAFLKNVESYTAEGTNKIVFKLSKPDFRFHNNFIAPISMAWTPLPKHIWEGKDFTAFKNNPPVGSGPYKLRSCNAETKVCIWERRDDYWRKDAMPAPRYVVFTKAPEADLAVREWEEGNYDLGNLALASVKPALDANPNLTTLNGIDPCPRRVAFNVETKPLDDVAVRRALGLLLDRQKIANLLTPPGYVQEVPWPYRGEVTGAGKWFNPDSIAKYQIVDFDPAQAAKILDEAGYKVVDGKRLDKDGKPMVLTAVVRNDGPPWDTPARLIAEEAKKLGIQVDVQAIDIPAFLAKANTAEWNMLVIWGCVSPADPIATYTDLDSTNYRPIGENAPGDRYRYKNPEMDALVAKMRSGNPEDPAIQELYRQAFDITYRDVPFLNAVSEYVALPINLKYWDGLQNSPAWVFWGNHFRQMLTEIKAK